MLTEHERQKKDVRSRKVSWQSGTVDIRSGDKLLGVIRTLRAFISLILVLINPIPCARHPLFLSQLLFFARERELKTPLPPGLISRYAPFY